MFESREKKVHKKINSLKSVSIFFFLYISWQRKRAKHNFEKTKNAVSSFIFRVQLGYPQREGPRPCDQIHRKGQLRPHRTSKTFLGKNLFNYFCLFVSLTGRRTYFELIFDSLYWSWNSNITFALLENL